MGIKISEAFPSKWLKAEDLKGKKIRVIIRETTLEKVGEDTKPTIYFNGKEKGVVLNKTNAGTIAFHYGDDTDEWEGKEILLYQMMVPFQGKMVPSIRVEVPLQEASEDEPVPF